MYQILLAINANTYFGYMFFRYIFFFQDTQIHLRSVNRSSIFDDENHINSTLYREMIKKEKNSMYVFFAAEVFMSLLYWYDVFGFLF